jgi:ABC-type phosphate/phosphonate transport system ATPase subunit
LHILKHFFLDILVFQDSSSALLVMKSLSHLVEKDGVTVVSVIHQVSLVPLLE